MNLTADCHPIASKSWKYSQEDSAFIDEEVKRLLKEGIIEPSLSPWRAQVVVTTDENHKKKLAIDYSQKINRFTLLDAFPWPRISDTVNKIAQYRVFSTIDLRSAYHQVSLKEEDKPYTAFEARGNLYQFTCLPFRVTNSLFSERDDEVCRWEWSWGEVPLPWQHYYLRQGPRGSWR